MAFFFALSGFLIVRSTMSRPLRAGGWQSISLKPPSHECDPVYFMLLSVAGV